MWWGKWPACQRTAVGQVTHQLIYPPCFILWRSCNPLARTADKRGNTMSNVVFQICLVPFVLFLSSSSRVANPHITGIYSDLRYNSEGGDLLGSEIFIVYSTDGLEHQYYAMLQTASGVPEPPVLVKVQVKEDSVFFDWPGYSKFRGRVSDKELTGAFDTNQRSVALRRKQSYWQ